MKKAAVQKHINVKKSEQRTGKLFLNTERTVHVIDRYERTQCVQFNFW